MRTLATLVLVFSLAVCFGCSGKPSYKDRTPDPSANDPGAAVASDPGIGGAPAAAPAADAPAADAPAAAAPAADAPAATKAEGEAKAEGEPAKKPE